MCMKTRNGKYQNQNAAAINNHEEEFDGHDRAEDRTDFIDRIAVNGNFTWRREVKTIIVLIRSVVF